MRSTIICVDDEKMLLNILAEQLGQWFGANYTIEKAISGEDALEILEDCKSSNIDVSVVISDYIMPNMKGDELLSKINQIDSRIRKIMLTGYSSIEGIISALNNGGLYRYLTKPWDTKDLMLTVLEAIKSYENEKRNIELTRGFEALYHKNEKLYKDFENNFNKTLQTLVCATEVRLPTMAGMAKEISQYCILMAKALKMTDEEIKLIEYMSLLHNVGVIGLNDDMINRLNNGEVSKDILLEQCSTAEIIINNMNDHEKLLKGIKYQYERPDGKGLYGMKAGTIPLEASVISLISFFVQKKAELMKDGKYSLTKVINAMKEYSGSKFIPNLVDLFIKIVEVKTV